MKTTLTTEQSQHLIDLGVPKEKATHVVVKQIYDFRGNSIKNPKEFIRKSPFRPAVMGFEAFDEHPIFNLEDFLNGEILPKEINSNGRNYYFAMECMPLGTYSLKYVTLDGKYYLMGNFFQSTELINALYKLACWYYGEYLKSEKK